MKTVKTRLPINLEHYLDDLAGNDQLPTSIKQYLDGLNISDIGDLDRIETDEVPVEDEDDQNLLQRIEQFRTTISYQADLFVREFSDLVELVESLPEELLHEPLINLPFQALEEDRWLTLGEVLQRKPDNPIEQIYQLIQGRIHREGCVPEFKKNLYLLDETDSLFQFWKQRLPSYLPHAFSRLTPDRVSVLDRRYGLMTPAKETLDEVRTTFGVSKERIRQIEEEALQNLDLFYLNGVNILVDRITQDRGGILPFDRLLNLQKSSDDSIRADQHWGMFRISGLLKLMRASEKEDFQVHNDRYLHSALDPDLIDDLTQTLPDIWDEQDEPQKLNQLADELMRRLDDVDPDTLEDRMPMPFEDVVRQLIDLHDDWGLSPFDNWGHQDHKEIEPSTHKDWAYVAMKDLDEPAHKDVIHRKAEEMSNEDLNNRGFYHAIQDMDESVLFEYGNAVYGLEQMKEEHDVKEPTTIIQLNYETLRDDAPQPLKSIIRSVRQQEDYSPSSIRTFLEADPRIVLTEEEDRDIYDLHPKHEQMGKSERGRGKWGGVSTDLQEDMAEQVLQKNDSPVPIDEISRQMSIQNDGGPFYTLNLRQVLLNSDDIVHKGENHYALSSNGYRHVTKDEAIEQVFEESGDGPLSKSEIARRVQEYRRMNDSKVYQTLRKHPDIFSPEKGKYILKEDLLD